MRHRLREDTLHSKQHQALIDTINRCDAELVSKEEILEDWREVMTEDFDEEDAEYDDEDWDEDDGDVIIPDEDFAEVDEDDEDDEEEEPQDNDNVLKYKE